MKIVSRPPEATYFDGYRDGFDDCKGEVRDAIEQLRGVAANLVDPVVALYIEVALDSLDQALTGITATGQ